MTLPLTHKISHPLSPEFSFSIFKSDDDLLSISQMKGLKNCVGRGKQTGTRNVISKINFFVFFSIHLHSSSEFSLEITQKRGLREMRMNQNKSDFNEFFLPFSSF